MHSRPICSAVLPAAGRVAAIAMHATQAIFVAELEIFAHIVVPLFDADRKPIYVVVRTGITPPLGANLPEESLRCRLVRHRVQLNFTELKNPLRLALH